MAGNGNLYASRGTREDEYYTDLITIENELKHYKEHFRDKVIFCNCDDPYESNFFKYFAMNFNALGLKKLISIGYTGSPIVYTQLSLFDDIEEPKVMRHPYKIEISEVTDENSDGAIDLADVELLIRNKRNVLTVLSDDGDFRGKESQTALEEADIVVTNPPFSLMKEYIPLLMNKEKKFLVLGNMNHITFKEIFPFFKENRIWLGYNSGHFWFKVPDYYEEKNTDFKIDESGQKWRRLGNICWFTNLEIEKKHQPLILYKHYTESDYPTYDNYAAIHISKVAEIPDDYYGVMGVPITFMDKYSPDQFEIVGITTNDKENIWGIKTKNYTISDAKNFSILNAASVLIIDGKPKAQYARVLVRRRMRDEDRTE